MRALQTLAVEVVAVLGPIGGSGGPGTSNLKGSTMRNAFRTSMMAVVLVSLSVVSAALQAGESLTGHWKAEFQKEDVTRDYFLAIVQEGSELKGSLISTRTRAYPFTSASVEGNSIAIDIERRYKSEDVVFKIRGEIQANGQIRGTLDIGGELIATIRMWRAPDPVGVWKVKSRSLDSDKIYESLLEIKRTRRGYGAVFTHEGKRLEVRETGWAEGRMILALAFPADDGEVPVVLAAEFVDENTIKGEWGVRETDRRSVWSATRVVAREKIAREEPTERKKKEEPEPKKEAVRPASFVGEWRSAAGLSDGGSVKFTLKLSGAGGELGGEIAGTTPSGVEFRSKLAKVEVEGRRISFSWDFEGDDGTARITMAGEVGRDGWLRGHWETGDSEGKWEGEKVLRL